MGQVAVTLAINLSTPEAEVGSLRPVWSDEWVKEYLELHRETLSQHNNNDNDDDNNKL